MIDPLSYEVGRLAGISEMEKAYLDLGDYDMAYLCRTVKALEELLSSDGSEEFDPHPSFREYVRDLDHRQAT